MKFYVRRNHNKHNSHTNQHPKPKTSNNSQISFHETYINIIYNPYNATFWQLQDSELIETFLVIQRNIKHLKVLNFDLFQDLRKPFESFNIQFHETFMKLI